MISFVNFARIASICVGFDLGTLHGYFFHQDFWPNLNFPLEYQIKLVLTSCPDVNFSPFPRFILMIPVSTKNPYQDFREISLRSGKNQGK